MSHDPVDRGPRDLFERASAGLDQGMAFRLRRARQQALQPSAPAPARGVRWLVPSGAFAAAALALGVAWWSPPTPVVAPDTPLAGNAEIEQLLESDEDPALYAWLADAPVATGSRP